MGTIRFVLRTDKPSKNGLYPTQLIYQISGDRSYFSPKKKCTKHNWDTQSQRAIFIDKKRAKGLFPEIPASAFLLSKEIEEINRRLDDIANAITDFEKKHELTQTEYTTKTIIESLEEKFFSLAKKGTPTDEVCRFIEKYINDHRHTREKGSLQVYNTLASHLKNFQESKKKTVTFQSLDYSLFQELQTFLITPHIITRKDKPVTTKLNNISAAKQLSTLKTVIGYAKLQGISVTEKYKDFRVKRESLEVIALTEQEFEALYHLDLSDRKTLGQVRDVFCFSCATGLRYSDISMLRREHIKNGDIKITVKKTKDPLTIPLTPYSEKILEKYDDHYRPLPVISNQKTNEYLKKLCKLAGIIEPIEIVRFRGSVREASIFPKNELVTIHVGRKTFATLSLEKGMSAEEVMAIGGWKDYKSFKRYVKITEQRKKVVMRNAWGEIKIPKMKAI